MSQFLHVYVQNALETAADLVPRIRGANPTLRQVLDLCASYRIAGIGFLFLSGTAGEFRARLQQSGAAYAAFLECAPEEEKRGSAAGPFFDAVVAGDLATAGRIAAAAPRVWRQGVEFEEDFLFPELLMQRFFLRAPPAACEAILSRWEAALAGSADPRLDVCRALLRTDAAGLEAGLAAFLAERQALLEKAARKDLDPPWLRDTEGKLSVEALALLRLAALAGVATEPEHPAAPSIALDDTPLPYSPDSWLSPGE